MKRLLIENLKVVASPSYWLITTPYSAEWDLLLNAYMQVGKFTRVCKHTVLICGVRVWTSNHPYASFTPYPSPEVRPSRKTLMKARERLVRDLIAETQTPDPSEAE